ncbi:hypothetical protein [Streptomyces sp. NPDC021020]|uniref:hypothetical protein n=1 Tax=Streptomyces sp. NPDC021020 TaxID=3365109 RepID=UPI0037BAF89B
MTESIWTYRATSGHPAGADLTGFKVEATAGAVASVDAERRRVLVSPSPPA